MNINSKQISTKLSELPIEELSYLTGFQIRSNGKISGFDFVFGFFQMVLQGFNTVEKWAANIAKLSGNNISAQALQKKLQFRHQKLAEKLFGLVLQHQIKQAEAVHVTRGDLFGAFGRVFLEDSTCVKLPENLLEFFPGSINANAEASTARIQLRVELLSGEYTYVELQSFRNNDQSFAYHIIAQLLWGDLVIRDLGYSALGAFDLISKQKAFFLSRLHSLICVYNPQTKQKINLYKKLKSLRHKGGNVLDIDVLAGQAQKLPVRLVAIKTPPQVEQARKRKAMRDSGKKRTNHSAEYMELLGWTILITNVSRAVWTPRQMLQAYGCRWYIEIIFKSWKTGFDFAHLFEGKQSMTPARAVISFYLLLIWLTLFFARLFSYFLLAVLHKKKSGSAQ